MLAYPSGEEGDNFLLQMISPALLRVEEGGGVGVGTLGDKAWKLLQGLDHHQLTDGGIKTKRTPAI